MSSSDGRPGINMSAIPVAGVGGLGLLIVSLVMATLYAQAQWLLAIGGSGGALLALALVLYRRRHRPYQPSGDDPTILFRPEPQSIAQPPARPHRRPDLDEYAVVG